MTNLPRIIRLRDAPCYLGMSRMVFMREVRPFVPEIPIGKRGIGFDRLDLDGWLEQHKQRDEVLSVVDRENRLWQERKYQDSFYGKRSGTLKKESSDSEFAKVLVRLASEKPNST
ncbi:MAG: hypothetical protein GY821_06380 [Gammaproteobacteria bacterium]|nr:hypothetical protein [Gammaproteobacteria bacterium]